MEIIFLKIAIGYCHIKLYVVIPLYGKSKKKLIYGPITCQNYYRYMNRTFKRMLEKNGLKKEEEGGGSLRVLNK